MVEVRQYKSQIGHTIIASLYGVVAQVFFNGRGVVTGVCLLQTIAIEGVALVLVGQDTQLFCIVFITFRAWEEPIRPFNSIEIVDT